MKKQIVPLADFGTLRQEAEKLLEKKHPKINSQISEGDALRILHELQVHQIELEMQNHELKAAKEQAEVASQKYLELYDFAPSGYFTLSDGGIIMELNLSGSQMLGKERKYLKNRSFQFFVSTETKPIFNLFLKNTFNYRTEETCEVTISSHDNLPKYVFLTGIVTENGDQCVVNVVDITERKKAEETLKMLEELNHASILQTAMDGYWMVDMQGFLLEVNETYCLMCGYSMEELLKMRVTDLEVIEGVEHNVAHIGKAISQKEDRFETQHRRKDGSIFDVEINARYIPTAGGRLVAFLHDITERKTTERYREMAREILQILNEPGAIRDLIQRVLTILKTGTGFDAVGVRLEEGDDFPYIFQKGFSKDFLLKENTLIDLSKDGGVCRDNDGKVCLACTCGLVISGKNDLGNPFFTPGGSFWTNDSSTLLGIPLAEEARFHPRNQCIQQGYSSVALVPIRNKDRIVGLLQFNDRLKERFTRNTIEKLEGITSHIGAAIMRKHAEDTLKESEKRRLAILETAMDGFWLLDMQGRLLEVNETYCRMSGYSAQELRSMRIADLESVESEFDTAAHLQKIILHGDDRFESRHRRKDRSTFDVEVSIQYQSAGGGQFVTFLHDITERKLAQENLRQSEERYKSLFRGNYSVMLLVDPDTGEIKDANPAASRYYGWAHSEICGKNISEINTLSKEQVLSEMQKAKKENRNQFFFKHRLSNDEVRDVELFSGPIRFGDSILLYSIVHDITERTRVEEALKENERLLRESQSVAHISSYSADLIAETWKASSEIYEIFGIDETYPHTLESWIGSIHSDFREELTKDLFHGEAGKKRFEHEYKIVRINDRKERWVQGLGEFEYDNELNPIRLFGTIQDITERKVKEEALQKLNQTLAALSKSSQAMSQSVDEADYLKQVCEIVVQDTDFEMVWIGYAEDDEAKTIRPMASAGFIDDYLETIKLSWNDSAIGLGPTGTAIRTGKTSMCNNMLIDPCFEPWREQALKQGFASSIVFPLKTGDKTFGAISFYSKEPESFLDVEINLLSELANDLAHGITTIRLRVAHQLAVKALSKSHNELEVLVKERTRELQIINDLLNKEINVRKQQEQSLKLAEVKYRTVADFTYGWEYWLDKNDSMLYCSPSCERITGYKASDFIQNRGLLFDIIYPDDIMVYQEHKRKENMAQERNYEIQYRIVRLDGAISWIGHVCQPIFDESGNFIGNRGSNRDITRRKEIEHQLKASNQKYELLSENITDGIFICKNGYFEYVNKAMNDIFGYGDLELDGMKMTLLAVPEYREKLDSLLNLNDPINQVRNLEIECSRKNLSIVFVEILLSYVANEGVIYGVIHDITEKRQIQKDIVKAIIQTEEKERANFSKELHDGLGPLLSTIKLYLQWSERPKSNKSREEIIQKAEEILEDALTTVKEISNKLSPHLLTNYGLTSAIQNFVDKLEATSTVKTNFESNVIRRLDIEIETAIYRATIECINNTIKHARASNITILLNDSGSQLQLQYSDDGCGFDLPEILSAQKGLGLINLQNRIKTLGGKIDMVSKPGMGVNYIIIINI